MRAFETEPGQSATNGSGTSAADEFSDGKSAVDDSEWFSQAAQRLLPSKPGTILHLTTGLGDERLCQRYAAGHVKPPAYFLRALLRSPHGRQWLAAVMEGSEADWWRDYKDLQCRSDLLARITEITKRE